MDELRQIYEEMSDWERTKAKHPDHEKILAKGWQHVGSYFNRSSGHTLHRYGNSAGKRLEVDHEDRNGWAN